MVRLERLEQLLPNNRLRLYAKLEMLNPGGSIKDRAALNMLREGQASGKIGAHTTIIESSSGNLGIGLAQACVCLGLRLICVVDTNITSTNLAILQAYGAEISLVKESVSSNGGLLAARIQRVAQLCEVIPDSYWVNQYANQANARAHHATMDEMARELGGEIDYVFVATSTCGTLRGCSEYVRQCLPRTKVVAVDAVGSVIFGQNSGRRLIPGHGASLMPALYHSGLEDRVVHVTDLDCVVGCRQLLKREAIFAGGSSGGVTEAVRKISRELPADSTCVLIFCDRGERYLDTIYSDAWVSRHFGAAALEASAGRVPAELHAP